MHGIAASSIMALILLALPVGAASTDDRPPHFLVQENLRKADAILRGAIVSSHKETGGFTKTTVTISEVYRGPFRRGETVTYAVIREQAAYDWRWLEHGVIVFLAGKVDQT